MKESPLTNKGWALKTLAGLIPGAALSLGVMVLLGHVCGSTGNPMTLSAQWLMWLAALVWVVCLNVCLLFRTGLGAWLCFGWLACLVWLINTLMSGFNAAGGS
ncbi:hypothetical protein [Asaia astilbis]|uniref:hypothetical protein n=1 Tax=Asaia astilbis TaxID=610244 RepID=UPI0004705424|nr:hypothetical protein [Asaia astilbis]